MKWLHTMEGIIDTDDNSWMILRNVRNRGVYSHWFEWRLYKIIDGIRPIFVRPFDTETQAQAFAEMH